MLDWVANIFRLSRRWPRRSRRLFILVRRPRCGLTTEGMVTGEVFCEFLSRLIENAPPPVYLIVDRHSVHR